MAKCLIVEDNLVNREIFVELLGDEGHDIVETSNGQDAIRALDERAFDLIVLDLYMPDVDGFAVGKHARASERNRDVKILVVSAADGSDLTRTKSEFAADAIVRKPLDLEEFISVSSQLLSEEVV